MNCERIQTFGLLVGDLQQLQHHRVRAHVPQQALLLLAALAHGRALLHAQLAEPDQDLRRTARVGAPGGLLEPRPHRGRAPTGAGTPRLLIS